MRSSRRLDHVAVRAFTLIEVLVVIAVIALLIAILLPSLAKARAAARTAACAINFKSISQGYTMYAGDFKDRIWESGDYYAPLLRYRFWYAQPQNPNFPVAANNPAVMGPAFNYLSLVDRVFDCPEGKRQAKTTFTSNPNDARWNTPDGRLQKLLWEEFLSPRNLNFDYTMATSVSGAKMGNTIDTAWDNACLMRTGGAMRPLVINAAPSSFRRLPNLPIYFEEDTQWYNAPFPDGLFSNADQISTRHEKKGHLVTLGGEVILLDSPHGPDPSSQNDLGELTANDFYVSTRADRWYQLAPSWPATNRPFGWIDQPR